jgi:hypothetical protein
VSTSPSRAETCIYNIRSPPTNACLGNFAFFKRAARFRASIRWSVAGLALSSLYARSCILSSHSALPLPHSRSFPHTTPLVCHPSFLSHLYQYANHILFSSAMGKSRSATVVIAYLMQEHNISPSEALSHLRQARSICEPNDGFMKQLELYGEMQTPENVEQSPAYQRWVYQREIELSRACGQAPEADKIRFEDEHVTDQNSAFELRCRKCR